MNSEIKIQVIEPPIYKELNWKMDRIMSALEYLRITLPLYLTEIPKNAKYFLINYGDMNGNSFPAIGVGSNDEEIMSKIPEFITLYDRVEEIILKQIGIEKIKVEIKNYPTISWNELKKIDYYPKMETMGNTA